jgi:creatinine amidohydrolase
MRSGYWKDLTTQDFGRIDPERTIALLPVSAVEQHGPHLPLGTDAIINAGIVSATLGLLDAGGPVVLVLPALEVGHSLEHTRFAGTLSTDSTTIEKQWCDVGRSVAAAGVRKLAIFNSHGGQSALVDLVALKLRAECDMLVARASYFAFGDPDGLFDTAEIDHGLHGGAVETSLMLHLAPGLVRRHALADFAGLPLELSRGYTLIGAEKPVGIGWMSQDLNAAGVVGNAAAADADTGRRYLEHLAKSLATLLAEIAALPLGTLDGGAGLA